MCCFCISARTDRLTASDSPAATVVAAATTAAPLPAPAAHTDTATQPISVVKVEYFKKAPLFCIGALMFTPRRRNRNRGGSADRKRGGDYNRRCEAAAME
jgi:hypothetical protein